MSQAVDRRGDHRPTVPAQFRRHGDMDRLFERQKTVLLDRCYQQAVGEDLSEKLEQLRHHIFSGEVTKEDRIPFVLVLPERYLNFVRQADIMAPYLNCPIGLDECWEDPLEQIPRDVYVASDIDLGYEFKCETLEETLLALRAAKRHPMTVPEGIALLRYFREELAQLNYEFFQLPGSSVLADPHKCPAILAGMDVEFRTLCVEEVDSFSGWIVPSVKLRRSLE